MHSILQLAVRAKSRLGVRQIAHVTIPFLNGEVPIGQSGSPADPGVDIEIPEDDAVVAAGCQNPSIGTEGEAPAAVEDAAAFDFEGIAECAAQLVVEHLDGRP
jgi:hypothetical protein